jgi:O-succinylbenzoate synthase
MSIDKIALAHIRIPLVEPFRISNGEIAEKDAIIVGVYDDGLVGYGESSPMSGSFYSPDTPESTWQDLRKIIVPGILDAKPVSIDEVNAILSHSGGNPFARAGLETAFWDLEGKKQNTPLYRLLGGTTNEVDCGLAVGIYSSIDELLQAVEQHLVEGYKRVKIKIQPGWDLEPLEALRRRFGSIPLMVDANCAYTSADIEHLRALDEFELVMIEQPLQKADLEGHARLQREIRTSICLDESAVDAATVDRAITLGSCRIVNIKIQRVGGLREAVRIHDLCARRKIPVWGGTMPELGIGSSQTVHLSTLSNFSYPTDVQSSLRWFVDDCIEPLLTVHNGRIRIASGSGNGYRLDERKIGRYLVQKEEFSVG